MKITMARKITVTVGRHSGSVNEYTIDIANPTVQDALDKAGIDLTKGDRIRLNGDTVMVGDKIANDDVITVTGRVSGGC